MKDLFSQHSSNYAAFRPTYPAELYSFIFQLTAVFDMAWDAGCGNGQVARDLAARFKHVYATDISAKQLENAVIKENIHYSVGGETTLFQDRSFDLITVGQAIHWFDRELFYKEVKRVGKPGAVIAIWGYGLLAVSPAIDMLIQHFYTHVVGPYWDRERRLIDEAYQTIAFPFDEIEMPAFTFSFEWSIDELEGYLTTWSSVQKFMKTNDYNPVRNLLKDIVPLWRGDKMKVTFPLFGRVGRVNSF